MEESFIFIKRKKSCIDLVIHSFTQQTFRNVFKILRTFFLRLIANLNVIYIKIDLSRELYGGYLKTQLYIVRLSGFKYPLLAYIYKCSRFLEELRTLSSLYSLLILKILNFLECLNTSLEYYSLFIYFEFLFEI